MLAKSSARQPSSLYDRITMLASAVTIAQPITFDQSASLRFLPEGPCPLGESKFSWVGIQHGADSTIGSINVMDMTSGRNTSHVLPGRPGFALPTSRDGVFVAGVERSLGLFDTKDQSWSPFCDGIDDDVENTIINDGLMVGDNLIFGTKDLEFATKKAGLYLYRGRDEKLIRLRDDQICSNGKALVSFNNDRLIFLDIDSPTRKIVRYQLDLARGTLGDAETIVDFEGDAAVPDGQIISPDRKSLIVAMFNPNVADHGETRMYDIASGQLQHVWITPKSPQNTCPVLIQHDGGIALVMTTAVENFDAAAQSDCPNAGRLFFAETHFSQLDDTESRWQL